MLTVNGRDIRNAAIYAGEIYGDYQSQIKRDLQPGFGIEFSNFGEMAHFLTTLGAQAMYRECGESLSMRTDSITSDDARLLVNDLQIDPLGLTGIVAYFPGWTLT